MVPTWVDSHCHLDMLKGDIDRTLASMFSQDLRFCVTIGTDYQSSLSVVDYCDRHPNVYGVVGIHPHNASGMTADHIDQLAHLATTHDKVVGIGECGFDFYYNRSSRSDQLKAFTAQMDVAAETGLPVVIHARDADEATRDVLKNYRSRSVSGVVHSFTSSREQAKWVLDAGFYISFNGICTFPKAESVREVLRYTPLDHLLLETDAPFLSPVPVRGKPNTPGNVSYIGDFVAGVLNLSPERLAEKVYQNTVNLFQKVTI